MSKGWIYVSGDWNIICDVCSVKTKASKTRKRWDGFQVCSECYETRHPQDFIRARNDKISVPFTRSQVQDTFTDASYITIYIDDGYTETVVSGITRQTYMEELQ
jgi:hypothetical protein